MPTQSRSLRLNRLRRKRPLVVSFPVGLRVAVAVGVALLMMVAFDIGYTVGSRQRPSSSPVAAVEKVENERTAVTKPITEVASKPLPKTEPNKTTPPKSKTPAVTETKPVETKPVETKPAERPAPKSAGPDRFATVIMPILRTKCISCHGDPATKGGLDLRSVVAMKQGGNSGTALVPGDLNASGLWKSIDDGTMPPAGKAKLTATEIAAIRQWIEQGSKSVP